MVRLLLILVLVLAVLVLIGFVLGYNKIRTADVRVAEALSGIDVELTRRASLIPSLVHTVQTFAAHEKGILDHVTDARAALTSATRGSRSPSAAPPRRNSTPRLVPVLALGQSYPQLNSSNNFLNLQDNLADTENKLAFARQYYNDAVATLNRLISTIPWMFVAPLSGCPSASTTRRRGRHANRLRRHPRARPAVAAPADRLAAPRRGRGADPPGRRRRPAGQAVAVAGRPVWRSSAASRCCGPTRPNSDEFVSELAELAPECCAVVAYGALLRDGLLAVPAARLDQPALLAAARVARRGAGAGGDRGRRRGHRCDHVPDRTRAGLRARSTASSPRRSGPPTPRRICLTGCRFRVPRCWRRRSTASPTGR